MTFPIHIHDGDEWVELEPVPATGRLPICFGSLASAPTAVGIGDTYLNSGSGEFFIWDGTTWLQIT